jgi:hypothetical protein
LADARKQRGKAVFGQLTDNAVKMLEDQGGEIVQAGGIWKEIGQASGLIGKGSVADLGGVEDVDPDADDGEPGFKLIEEKAGEFSVIDEQIVGPAHPNILDADGLQGIEDG